MSIENQENAIQSVSNLFGTLSHPTRLKLLGLLAHEEMDVTHLRQTLGVSQPSVSQHLSLLKNNGLVAERREGKHVFYSIKSPQIKGVIASAVNLLALNTMAGAEAIQPVSEILSLWGV